MPVKDEKKKLSVEEQAEENLGRLHAAEIKCLKQGHSLLDVLAWAAKHAFGIDARPDDPEVEEGE
jgi:hypothetical protein